MCRKVTSILLMMSITLSITACGKTGEDTENMEVRFHAPEAVQKEAKSHVTEQSRLDGKELYIDADVEVSNPGELAEVTLTIDEEKIQKFTDELVPSKYPGVSEQKLVSCSVSENGFLSYLDIVQDLNSPYMDGEHIFEYGYITEMLPPGMDQSADEAAEEARQFLGEYSCFSFEPWNILAGDKPDPDAKSGCYYISMQAIYEGIPVSVKGETNLSATVVSSNDGIFQVQGLFTFQDSEIKKINQIAALDSVLGKFRSDFAFFSEGDTINVNRIALEYFPEQKGDDSYKLIPVWTFDCAETRIETNEGENQEIVSRYSYMYSAVDGKFYGLYY